MSSEYVFVFIFFFFKQKTAYEMRISDWSSDVCSSDLVSVTPSLNAMAGRPAFLEKSIAMWLAIEAEPPLPTNMILPPCAAAARKRVAAISKNTPRSEERRVGKE